MTNDMHNGLSAIYKGPKQRKEIGAHTARALIKRGFATEDGNTITITEFGRSAAESGIAGWILRRSQEQIVEEQVHKTKAQLDREIKEVLTEAKATPAAPKAGEYTKLATATDVPRIEKYINEFAHSTNYRVDPETLQITNAVSAPPEKWFVMRHRGGYLFGRKQ